MYKVLVNSVLYVCNVGWKLTYARCGGKFKFVCIKRVGSQNVTAAVASALFAEIQFQGFLVASQIYAKHRHDCLMAFMTRKRSALYRKLKIAIQRQLMRRKRGCWFKPG